MVIYKIKNFLYFHVFKYLDFVIFDKIVLKWKRLNEKSKNNLNNVIYSNYITHPFINFQYIKRLSENDPITAYKKLENYNFLKNEWLELNKKYHEANDYIPEQQVIGSFGNYATLFYYLFYRLNIEKKKEKPKLLLKNNERITNKELYNFFEPFIDVEYNSFKFYKKLFIKELNKVPLEISLPYQDMHYPISYAINYYNQKTINKALDFKFLKLNKDQFERGQKILNKIGIKNNDWYVLLHVRDINDNHNFRNSNPITYIKAIKKIISNGGYVIRMGRNEKIKFPEIKGLIDYPFTSIKSDFMDIFLAATCKFCIGTSSGFASLPTYFNRPLMLVNCLPTGAYFELRKEDMFLPKILVNKNTNKVLSIEKYFNLPVGTYFNNEIYEKNNLEIYNNSEEELELTTQEMIDNTFAKKNDEKDIKDLDFKKTIEEYSSNFFTSPLKSFGNFSSQFINKFN